MEQEFPDAKEILYRCINPPRLHFLSFNQHQQK